MDTLKHLFYFDEYTDEDYNHKGGSKNIVTTPLNEKNDNIDEKKLSSEILDFWNDILEIAKDNLKRFYNIFIGWILTPIVFGSFAPALPFFLVMGVLYGIFNYFQKLIIKL